VPDRDLAVVVAINEARALFPATEWRYQAHAFAGGITVLLAVIVIMTFRSTAQAKSRELAMVEERAVLAAANAQLEIARAESAEKTEQLEATLRGMTDGVSMMDGRFCLVEWNARFPEIAGIPPEALRVGMPMEEILRLQAQGGQFGDVDVEAEVSRRMAVLRTRRFGVTQRSTPNGRSLELRRNALPDGGFVTLYSDITAHKAAEAALRAARTEAEAASAAKSQFVAIVSHEIRTPLNALLNTLRLLADTDLPPAQRAVLDVARASGDALSSLINDILEMSRAQSGHLTLRPSTFALRGVLEASLEVFQTQAAARGIRFALDIGADVPPEMRTDPSRLRQILLNLLSNAVKFAEPGTVRLRAWTDDRPADNRHWLGLAVQDGGPVIPEADRRSLFRPFVRLERAEDAEVAGTGLGLSICHALAEALGGTIGCDVWTDDRGVAGNSFWLTVPVTVPAAPEPAEPRIAGPPDAGPPDGGSDAGPALVLTRPLPRTRILLVEDVPANQIVTTMLLRRRGHLVDVAANGPAAIAAARRTPYDIIFMDIFMPGMSGQEATQHIRAQGGLSATVPIIALTANVASHDEAVFREAGMSGVLGKPVSVEALTETLRRHVWRTGAPPDAGEAALRWGTVATAGPTLDNERLRELTGNLPPSTLHELIEECLTDLDLRLPALRRAMAAGAPGSIEAHAHAMVGMAASYGMAALQEHLRTIVTAARAGDTAALGPDTAREVETILAQTARALRALIAQQAA
jgi:signal transduction histidine kinase/ActR/RegA family two-component response regulator/HPt (histidine-containing phosphotransfer) domain-containing protein